jgi:hypothetical protein
LAGTGFGSTMVFAAPPGAGCMSGGVPPCGLAAGAPPDPVESGPVQPCGWGWPRLSGNTVRPVLQGESPGFLSSFQGWAAAVEMQMPRHSAVRAKRIFHPRMSFSIELGGAATVPRSVISDREKRRAGGNAVAMWPSRPATPRVTQAAALGYFYRAFGQAQHDDPPAFC